MHICAISAILIIVVGCSNDAPFRSSIWKTDTTGVESKSRRGHTSLSRRKKLTVLGDIVTTTEMSKHHHHHKHKQGANQDENKTEDGKTIVPIDPTTDIGKVSSRNLRLVSLKVLTEKQ